MTWRLVGATVAGTSHVAAGIEGQDAYVAQVRSGADGSPLLTIFVADGAGSAARAGDGARIATATADAFIEQQLQGAEFSLSDELAVACTTDVRARLYQMADEAGLAARDFACTLLGIIATNQHTLVLQIGDGASVLDLGEGLEVAIAPMTGEYANETSFVTDHNAIEVLKTRAYPKPARRIAVMTDGLQRLAIKLVNNIPCAPFFDPLFQFLATVGPESDSELQQALCTLLQSECFNERTDDDKTLVLALM